MINLNAVINHCMQTTILSKNILKIIPCMENGNINIWGKYQVSTVVYFWFATKSNLPKIGLT